MIRHDRRPKGPHVLARRGPRWSPPARAPRRKDWTLLICSAIVGAGLVLALGTYCSLEAGRRSRAEAWANQAVAEKLGAGHALLARREWGQAVTLAQDALATEDGTNRDAAQALLAQAQAEWAAAVLDAARAALGRKNRAEARELLRRYLDDPQTSEKDQALGLCDEIEQAERHEAARREREAADRLARQRQQEAQRRREARLRATPVFAELTQFVAAARDQHHERQARRQEDERLLALLFRALRVKSPKQRAALWEELRERQAGRDTLEADVARARPTLKERFWAYKGFDDADRQAFDQAVDALLDSLLKEIQEPRRGSVPPLTPAGERGQG